MALQQFSLVSPNIQSGQLFQSLVTALPPEVIEQVIDQTGTREQRSRLLPTQLVVCLIIALSLWSHDSMKDVLKNLLDGWGQKLLPLSQSWHIPGKTAITKARQRVGPRVMSTLFQRLCRPMATPETPGAFLQGLRLVGVDVVVNNAGFGLVAAVEEATDAEARKQFDTNVFGLLNVTRAVLPYLRAQNSGRVLNMSSLYGYDTIAGWGVYGATKFAVKGLSKALALELAPLGIYVTAMAPGLFTTEFLSAESYAAAENVIADYQETVGLMRSRSNTLNGHQPGDPKKLAQVILQLAAAEHPPIHLPIGKDSVARYRNNAANIEKEIAAWLPAVTSTDHDQGITASTITQP